MPRTRVEFHPEAIEEAAAAHLWYRDHSEAAADAFFQELEEAIEQVVEAPDRWPSGPHGTRRYLLRRFPYMIVYRQREGAVHILAVAHGRRKPGYWRGRSTE